MRKVAIVTGSEAAIPKEIAQEYEITTVPVHVIVDGKDYLDGAIDIKWLYARMKQMKQEEKLPTTSFAPPVEFLQAYNRLAQGSEDILYISMTSAFSKGYGAAIEAKELAREKLPGTRIEIIDSHTVEAGEVPIVLDAARAAKEGKDLSEIIKLTGERITQISNLQTFDTLFYRNKQGRIFEAKSWAEAESSASFRSIVEVDASTGGVTKPVARVRTKTQAISKMVDIAKERVGDKKLHAAISHANVPDQAEQLRKILLSQFQCEELYITEASAGTVVQVGEGFISFGFYGSD